MERQQIPLAQIAGALGVSRTTVCRALSGKGRVNPETARRVREYLLAEKADAAGHTGPLALVLSPELSSALLQAICAAAQRNGRGLVLLPPADPPMLLRQVLRQQVMGVLLPEHPRQREWAAVLREEGIPCVVLGDTPRQEFPQVTADPSAALRELNALLRMKGLGRTALLAKAPQSPLCRAWRQEAGPDARMYELSDSGLESALDRALADGADCLVFEEPSAARNGLYLLRGRGVAVPQRLGLVCLRDAPTLAGGELSITALHWDEEALAAAAVCLLTGQGQALPPVCQLILRNSTRR